MKLKYHYFLAFLQSLMIIYIPSLGDFFTLGDRDRYIALNEIDYSENFNRSVLTDQIFNYGGQWLETLLGIISVFLHFYLVNAFCKTLEIDKLNRLIAFLWLLLPVHFILRSIAGKELICSILFCILILIFYPIIFFNKEINNFKFPGQLLRKNKIILFLIASSSILLLCFIRPFFLLIFFMFFIPYLYKKIKLNPASKKLIYLSIFSSFVAIFITSGRLYYDKIQEYISLNFVGQGDSFFTNNNIPYFDSFFNYMIFLLANSYKAISGPDLSNFLSSIVYTILFLEGLIVILPILSIIIIGITKFLIIKKISLQESFTNSISLTFFILIFSLLGYVNFLAGWRLQSGAWILFIMLYLKMCNDIFQKNKKFYSKIS